jgi:uncharacterized damage-inducible protein DinB
MQMPFAITMNITWLRPQDRGSYITPLSWEQFTQHTDYSHGSVRDQIVHLMSADDAWFSGLRTVEPSEPFPTAENDDRQLIHAHWDKVEQNMRA